MKTIKTILLILYLFSIVTNGFAEETIRLTNGEWPPYLSKNLKYYGVASRIVAEAFALEGIKVKYVFYPWKRAYQNAETGKWDGSVVWFDTPKRRTAFYISDSVIDVQYVFFHLKSYSFNWDNIEDLKGIRIGGTLGYNYSKMFQKAEETGIIKVERVPKDEQNFKKLLKGRIQIFPNDLDVGYAMLRNIFAPEQVQLFTYHPKPVRAAPHHLLLSKKIKRNKRMIELFNKGLKRLKANGQVEQYLIESRRGEYKNK